MKKGLLVMSKKLKDIIQVFYQKNTMLVKTLLTIVFIRIVLFSIALLLTGATSTEKTNPRSVISPSVFHSTCSNIVFLSDSGWYRNVAVKGYTKRPFSADRQDNWAFFPLWPAVIKAGMILGIELVWWTGMLSFLFTLLAGIYLFKLFQLDYSERIAFFAVLMINVFPSAYFYQRSGTEAIFLFLAAASLYYGRNGKWILTSILGIAAVLCRVQGILLSIPLLLIMWNQFRKDGFKPSYLTIGLLPAALLGFCFYLYTLTGDFFATLHIQSTWGNVSNGLFSTFFSEIKAARFISFWGWDLSPVTLLFLSFSLIGLVIGFLLWKRKKFPLEYLLYLIPNFFLLFTKASLLSSVRYIGLLFPLILIPAILTDERPVLRQWVIWFLTVFLVFFYSFAVLKYQWAIA